MFSHYAAVLERNLNLSEHFSAPLLLYPLITFCWHSGRETSSSRTRTLDNTVPSSIKQGREMVDITDSTTLLLHMEIEVSFRNYLLTKTPLHLRGGADDDSDSGY
jgi:hypothetical protein